MNMKGSTKLALPALLLAGLAAVSSNCILEDRVVEVVLNDSTCAAWNEKHTSESYTNAAFIDMASEIGDILEENHLEREDIVQAHLVNATYRVTSFSHTHDWEVTGYVTIERYDIVDGPAQLFDYTSQSIADALGLDINAPLAAEGVGILNRALADYIEGGSPVLVCWVYNGAVSPPPSADDPIEFGWRACLSIQVVMAVEAEVPEIF